MSYEVVFAPTARREMAAVPERVIPAIIEFVYGDLAANPRRVCPAQLRVKPWVRSTPPTGQAMPMPIWCG